MLSNDGISTLRVLGLYAWRRGKAIVERSDAITEVIQARAKALGIGPGPQLRVFAEEQRRLHGAAIWRQYQQDHASPGYLPQVIFNLFCYAVYYLIFWALFGNPIALIRHALS